MAVDKIITMLYYPAFLTLMFLLTLLFIPRGQYKHYLIYGLLIGALGDTLVVALMQNLLHIMWFKNQGIFNVLGQMALSPLCWTLVVMLYLFFLPNRRWFMYLYIATWAFLSLGYGYMVKNANLFDFKRWLYPIPAYFIFLGWWIIATLLFIRTSSLRANDKD